MVTKCSARDFVTKRGKFMPTVKLTKRSVDGLLPPAKGQAVLWDTEVRGFGARILPSGTKTFILQYRNPEGIQRRINIGRYGILTVDQARDQAKLHLASVIKAKIPPTRIAGLAKA
jgi:hypothetical protein